MIADSLRLQCRWIWWHTPSGELRTKATAAKLQRMGVKKGVADFLLVKPHSAGRLYALELKRKGKKPSQEQLDFGEALEQAGGVWDWCDSYERAIAILKRWGALPDGFNVA
jgi:hypothetical protein